MYNTFYMISKKTTVQEASTLNIFYHFMIVMETVSFHVMKEKI